MTPIQTATDDIKQRVSELNQKVEQYRAEGLMFQFVADPAFTGIALQAPLDRATFQ